MSQTSISQLKAEIGELCRLVVSFEERVAQFREKVFNYPIMTEDILWGYMFAHLPNEIGEYDLYKFMHKHNKPVSKLQCKLLCHRSSSNRNGEISKQDLWELMKPRTIRHTESIIALRKKKKLFSDCPELPFDIKDAIISVVQETLQYETFAEKMKQNIEELGHDQTQWNQFSLKEVSPQNLQVYLIEAVPELRIANYKRILEHILTNKKNKEKVFYSFFHPLSIPAPKKNPTEKILNTQTDKLQKQKTHKIGFTSTNKSMFFNESKKIWKYGKTSMSHNKPLYLI